MGVVWWWHNLESCLFPDYKYLLAPLGTTPTLIREEHEENQYLP